MSVRVRRGRPGRTHGVKWGWADRAEMPKCTWSCPSMSQEGTLIPPDWQWRATANFVATTMWIWSDSEKGCGLAHGAVERIKDLLLSS